MDALECNFGCPHPRDLGYKSGQELGADPEAAATVTKSRGGCRQDPRRHQAHGRGGGPGAGGRQGAGRRGGVRHRRQPVPGSGHRPRDRAPALCTPATPAWAVPGCGPSRSSGSPRSRARSMCPSRPPTASSAGEDVVKMIMVGAGTVQTCTADHVRHQAVSGIVADFLKGLDTYLDEHGYASVQGHHRHHAAADPDLGRGGSREQAPLVGRQEQVQRPAASAATLVLLRRHHLRRRQEGTDRPGAVRRVRTLSFPLSR